MTRRAFFAFHFENDLSRVDQIRAELGAAEVHQVGFFDPAEYGALLRADKATIRRVIRERVEGTSVTIVLIGTGTASQPFVHVAVEESIAHRNGLLGIHVHALDDQDGQLSFAGPAPIVPAGVEFPCYTWDWDFERFAHEIELAGKRADRWRRDLQVRS